MAKQLHCLHPEIGEQLMPPFVIYGTANAEVGELYCGMFRGTEWHQGDPLHPAGDQSRWAFEFANGPHGGTGWSVWIGEMTDSMPMLQLYPLSIAVPAVIGQLIVRHPAANHLAPCNHVLAYGISSTPLDRHVIDIGGVETVGTVLRNNNGRFAIQWSVAVAGVVPAILKFRNGDMPPSMAERNIRVREV